MKFGIHYIYWRKDLDCQSYIPYVEKARLAGFDNLELGDYLVLEMSDRATDELAAAAAHYDMPLTVGLDPPRDCSLTDDSQEVCRKGMDFYAKAFARLAKLRVTTLSGHMLNAQPRAPYEAYRQREWEAGVQSMRCMGKQAAEYGITLCIEVVNRFEGHIFNTAKDGRRFVDEVGLPNVKLLLDSFHMNIEESGMANAILDAGSKLGHFHFMENHRGLPGTGHICWNEIRDSMRHIGYDGVMVMEAHVRAGGTLGDSARIWRDLTGKADEDELIQNAKRSLAFSRFLFAQGTI